jgi:hypothetical protein
MRYQPVDLTYTISGKMARKDCYENSGIICSIADFYWAVFTREDIDPTGITSTWKYTLVAHSENYIGDNHAQN